MSLTDAFERQLQEAQGRMHKAAVDTVLGVGDGDDEALATTLKEVDELLDHVKGLRTTIANHFTQKTTGEPGKFTFACGKFTVDVTIPKEVDYDINEVYRLAQKQYQQYIAQRGLSVPSLTGQIMSTPTLGTSTITGLLGGSSHISTSTEPSPMSIFDNTTKVKVNTQRFDEYVDTLPQADRNAWISTRTVSPGTPRVKVK